MKKKYYHEGGGVSYCNIPTHFMSLKKTIIAGQYLFDHVVDFVYALCFLGIMIFASEFAEGHNKGGNLLAIIFCAGFIYGIFILNKKWNQKIGT